MVEYLVVTITGCKQFTVHPYMAVLKPSDDIYLGQSQTWINWTECIRNMIRCTEWWKQSLELATHVMTVPLFSTPYK